MSDVFFYGTLRHVPLLREVLGRAAADLTLIPGTLDDHAVRAVEGEDFPMIEPAPGAVAEGLVARGLNDEDLARLDYYEGGFDYGTSPLPVRLETGDVVSARVFFPRAGQWCPDGPWSLRDWADRHGAITARMAKEIMAHRSRYTAQQMLSRYHTIRMRAAGWVASRHRPADPDRDIARDVIVHTHHHPYMNFFAMEEMDLQYRRHDGTMSEVVNRGALIMGEAAVVLPYDPVRDTVLLVEQFRAPVYMGGSRAPWVWEPIAGLMDPGESPEACARREAMEEAGLNLRGLDAVGPAYSSTGSSCDYVHMFVGLTDLVDLDDPGGLDSEGEDIRSCILSFEALMDGIDRQGYCDMPLLITALWLARHRDRLRAMA